MLFKTSCHRVRGTKKDDAVSIASATNLSLLFIPSFRGSVLPTCPAPLPVDAHYRPITSGSGHEAPGTSGLLLRSLSHDTLARPCTITPSLIAKTPSDSEDTVRKTSLDTHTDGKMGRWTKKQGDSNTLPHRTPPHPTNS